MGRGGTGSHPCESMSNDYRASSDRPDPMKIQTSAFIKNVSVPWIFTGLKIDENTYYVYVAYSTVISRCEFVYRGII